jgi:hypothetical protein
VRGALGIENNALLSPFAYGIRRGWVMRCTEVCMPFRSKGPTTEFVVVSENGWQERGIEAQEALER